MFSAIGLTEFVANQDTLLVGPEGATEGQGISPTPLFQRIVDPHSAGRTGRKVLKPTESLRSAPPDTTPYARPLVREDCAPGGRPAIPSAVSAGTPRPYRLLCPAKPPKRGRE